MIIEGIYLPQQDGDAYSCWETPLVTNIEMISGRVVQEVRGSGGRYKVWRARIAFDLLDNGTFRAIYPVLKSGGPFSAFVLPPHQEELIAGTFLLESISEPTFAFDDRGEAVWRGLAFQIREVSPHA